MRAHYFQHVPFEGLGHIETCLRAAGYDITSTRFFESADLPDVSEIDFLVVMGGPMSANDESVLPWLTREKEYIRHAIRAGKPVLGVCLGAQLIASAMGARVFQNREKEIGWFPVRAVPSPNRSVFRFPPSLDVFHWHGETFDLPPGAVLLARSDACLNQAFQIGRSVIGLQFHLETTPETAREIASHCRAELVASRYVQSETTILQAAPEKYQAINILIGKVLAYLLHRHSLSAQSA